MRWQFYINMVIHNVYNVDIEYWHACELSRLLGYERWKNFDKAVICEVKSCNVFGITVSTIFAISRKWLNWVVMHKGRGYKNGTDTF